MLTLLAGCNEWYEGYNSGIIKLFGHKIILRPKAMGDANAKIFRANFTVEGLLPVSLPHTLSTQRGSFHYFTIQLIPPQARHMQQ